MTLSQSPCTSYDAIAVAISSTAIYIHKEIGGNFYLSIWLSTNLLENFDLHITSVLFLQLLRHRLQVRPAAEADDGKWSCNILTKFALCFIFAD